MSAALPTDWPKCGAETKSGAACGQLGAGWNKRCRWHGGLNIPAGDWIIIDTRAGLYLVNRSQPSADRTRLGWIIAGMLVTSGRVKSALFGRGRARGSSLIRYLTKNRVVVKTVLQRADQREYAFEAQS